MTKELSPAAKQLLARLVTDCFNEVLQMTDKTAQRTMTELLDELAALYVEEED